MFADFMVDIRCTKVNATEYLFEIPYKPQTLVLTFILMLYCGFNKLQQDQTLYVYYALVNFFFHVII